jgi:hypothetical protein
MFSEKLQLMRWEIQSFSMKLFSLSKADMERREEVLYLKKLSQLGLDLLLISKFLSTTKE